MMATTHVLAGVALAAVVATASPTHADAAVLAAALGGLFPDLDLYAGHRKTLHFPVYYALAAVPAAALAAVTPSMATVAAACFLAAAAFHCAMDAFGGGLELRPWRGVSQRAVYDHFRGRWIRPRRWIRYDGAPEDLALAGLFAVPGLVTFGDPVQPAIVAVLCVSAAYALLRKRMVRAAERFVGWLPERLLAYVPERFVGDLTP